MSKYTLGPWIGKDENGKFNSNHEWRAEDESALCSSAAPIWANGKVIALVVCSSDYFSIESDPSIDGNARLIAEAPALLAMLLDVQKRIKESDEWWMDIKERGGFDIQAIDALIAKATGEQS